MHIVNNLRMAYIQKIRILLSALENVWLKDDGTPPTYNYYADFSMGRQGMVLAREEACTNTGAVDSRSKTVSGLFRVPMQMNKLYKLKRINLQ